MDDRLLDDYLQELRWLRTASGEFARRHPQVASRLRLSEFDCPDPHVERLLEGFALQSARLHQRLDDGYGELCESLLEQLSPHLMRPFPACGTACFRFDPLAGDLSQGYALPAGTPLYALTEGGETIWWRTALTQTLWPLEIEDVVWCDATQARHLSGLAQARGALRIQLCCLPPHQFSSLAINRLLIHLCGSPQINATLFDLLYAHGIGPRRPQPVGLLNAERILPVESGVESSALALSAWMHCPQALMYFDLPFPEPGEGDALTLCIPFDRAPQAAQHIQPGDIRLGCTPVVNLFTRTSEPLLAEHTRSEHRLVADQHDKNVHIYRVQELWMSRRDEAWRIPPYYSAHGHNDARWYWYARRHRRQGNAMWLTLVDSRFDPVEATEETSLTAKPWRFSLEQCVRILQVGGEIPALRGDLGMTFSPAEVGVLPYGWLDWLQQATQDKNAAPHDFIQLFQQRFIQHHCRSLSLYRLATPYARRENAPGLVIMRALCGFRPEATTMREAGLLAQSAGLANRRRSTAGFVALVEAVLNVTVLVEEFVGRWQPLPQASISRTGCRLGRNSVAGRRIWNQHAALRVHLHAESAAQWRAFLPDGQGFIQLSKLGKIWFGPGITLQLMMRGTLKLDRCLRRDTPPRLGYTAQLAGRRPAAFYCQQQLEENNAWT